MNNKKIIRCISALMFSFMLSACNLRIRNSLNDDPKYNIYLLAKESGETDLSYEEWLASIKGDKGDQGEPGKDGVDGKDGADGKDGQDGADGKDGEPGADGQDGKDGSSLLTGEGEPSEELGNTGDTYIDLSTWNVYTKTNEGWQLQGNIKGATGQDGDSGQNGKSAYELYIEQYPGYTWGESQWIKDLATGNLTAIISFETYGGETIEPLILCKGEEITIDFEASKDRGTFNGWYLDDSFENEITYTFIAEKSITLYAKFIMDKVSVTFISDGETYSHAECDYGSPVIMPTDPVKLGYEFASWAKENGIIWNKNNLVMEDNLVLYAKYNYDFLEIPAVIINTNDGSNITSKEVYTDSKVSILNTEEEWQMENVAAGVRGRGNSTWTGSDKKPYRIKFNKKQSILGSNYKAKSWTLIANYFDKSLLRNYSALEMSRMFEGLSFTSCHHVVDLYLNDEYKGVYLLCDQIQTGEGRVDIDESVAIDGNNGYFIERDNRAVSEGLILDQDYFIWEGGEYVIKTPDTEEEFIENKAAEIEYIKNCFDNCFAAITSGSWEDVLDLVDVNSFCDAYIIDELFMNGEINTHSSFFFKDVDGKLTKGPIWDYDTTAGNNKYFGTAEDCPANGPLYCGLYEIWYHALIAREEFVNMIKQKFVDYDVHLKDLLLDLDTENENGIYLKNKNAMERNFERWQIMGQYVYPQPYTVYSLTTLKEQIDYLRDWLFVRYKFLYETYRGETYEIV